MNRLRSILLGTALAVTPGLAWSQAHPTLAFAAGTNPSGDWSFGMKPTATGVFDPLDVFSLGSNIARWGDGSTFGGVYYSFTGPIATGGGTISMHPFVGGDLAVLRYTAPSAGYFLFSGFFANGDHATTDVYMMLNGSTLTSGYINGPTSPPVTFNATLSLLAGDVVDFQVGRGNGDYGYDTVHLMIDGFQQVVDPTAAPEPASLVLLATGLIGVGAVRRRRSLASRVGGNRQM